MPFFSYISENWTNVYVYCSFKLIINNECLVYIHSLHFALIIYETLCFPFLTRNRANFAVRGLSSLTLRSKVNVVSGSWMYLTHPFVLIDPIMCQLCYANVKANRRCGTLKNTQCSMAASAKNRSNFAALYR